MTEVAAGKPYTFCMVSSKSHMVVASTKTNKYIMFINLETFQTEKSITVDDITINVGDIVDTSKVCIRGQQYDDYLSFINSDDCYHLPGYVGFYTFKNDSVSYHDGKNVTHVCNLNLLIGGSNQVSITTINNKQMVIMGSPPNTIIYDNLLYKVGDNSAYGIYVEQFIAKLPPIEDPVIANIRTNIGNMGISEEHLKIVMDFIKEKSNV